MKNILAILVLFSLSSCRIFNKNLVKTKEKEKTDTEIKTSSEVSAAATSTSAANRTITTQETGELNIKGTVITATGTAKDLDEGKTIRTETPEGTLDLRKDLVTGVITATATTKDKKIPFAKTTTTVENVNTVSSASSAGTFSQDVRIKEVLEKDNKEVVVSKEPGINFIAIGFGLTFMFLFIIAFIVWWINRKKKQIFPPAT
jgi:hypothetical protein